MSNISNKLNIYIYIQRRTEYTMLRFRCCVFSSNCFVAWLTTQIVHASLDKCVLQAKITPNKSVHKIIKVKLFRCIFFRRFLSFLVDCETKLSRLPNSYVYSIHRVRLQNYIKIYEKVLMICSINIIRIS